MQLEADSLERLVPDEVEAGDTTGEETLRLHVDRYRFAASHLRPGRTLDVACGVGYGTRILSDEGPEGVEALGVDLSEAAVGYALEHYANAHTRYDCTDAMRFESDAPFDNIVSIETIEHLPEPVAFITRMAGLLAPGAHFIASVPTTPSVDANPHHLHDFSERSFRRPFEALGLREVDCFTQDQPFRPGAVVTRSEARMQQVRPNLPGYYLRNPDALLRRVYSTLRHGFKNRYLTVVWRRES